MDHCEMNCYDSNAINRYVALHKHILVDNIDEADVLVINTCIFNNYNEVNAKKYILDTIRRYPNKEIMIIGCLPNYDKRFMRLHRLKPFPIKALDRANLFPLRLDKFIDSEIESNYNYFLSRQDKVFYIKIARGCIHNCSYCAIKLAKGYVKSVKSSIIIDAILKHKAQLRDSFLVLLSDDAGSYGVDIGDSFVNLLNGIYEITLDNNIRLIISDWHPERFLCQFDDVNPRLWEKVHYINIPIQSVSPRIIMLMNRKYNIRQVFKKIMFLRGINPDIKITSHILYCFPTETIREFKDTLRCLKYFDRVIYSCYSDRLGIKSASIEPKITEEEKIRRTIYLIERQKENPEIKIAESDEFYKAKSVISTQARTHHNADFYDKE